MSSIKHNLVVLCLEQETALAMGLVNHKLSCIPGSRGDTSIKSVLVSHMQHWGLEKGA